ncbi:DUF2752 domain-containing protein [Myroides pelagicus]|uniref:DUF2752 domain-containing protein n=1 Tax=Myroides pelagicus TaxID=270914 RepID=A0A7K1GLL9_9FLAO|nr:DUF2752 domain-containing protein [Myroides pelagicus]MEC4115107.1 DUF2752 domain-containing protein [Myroides pelagicus]MTH29640.1 DUF2752 domain-containing protein [Myroides pelagicus]
MKKVLPRLVLYSLPVMVLYYYYAFFGLEDNTGVVCIIHEQIGWLCPGCGGQRALNAMLHGEFIEAFHYNQLIYMYISLIAFLYIAFVEVYILNNRRFKRSIYLPHWFVYALVAIVIVFVIARNL